MSHLWLAVIKLVSKEEFHRDDGSNGNRASLVRQPLHPTHAALIDARLASSTTRGQRMAAIALAQAKEQEEEPSTGLQESETSGPRVELTGPTAQPDHAHMASRTIVELTDDLDGKPAAETVTFALDGRTFEIDLSEKNAKALRKTLEPWVASARRASGRQSKSTKRVETSVDTAAVRAWAGSNGIELSARGRLPRDVVEQYRAAGN